MLLVIDCFIRGTRLEGRAEGDNHGDLPARNQLLPPPPVWIRFNNHLSAQGGYKGIPEIDFVCTRHIADGGSGGSRGTPRARTPHRYICTVLFICDGNFCRLVSNMIFARRLSVESCMTASRIQRRQDSLVEAPGCEARLLDPIIYEHVSGGKSTLPTSWCPHPVSH
jgi:hypothetical protein